MARFIAGIAAAAALAMTGTASAGSVISNDMSRCSAGEGPAVKVVVQGIKSSTGKLRVQTYPQPKPHGSPRAAGCSASNRVPALAR